VAEVRSLVVDQSARRHGVGTMLVDELRARARREGFDKLCAFTHAPGYFMPMGFSIVPHLWIPEKIFTDCVKCSRFRHCGQHAMMQTLDSIVDTADRDVEIVARHA
jgi:amino-acid N-acetyltransferase